MNNFTYKTDFLNVLKSNKLDQDYILNNLIYEEEIFGCEILIEKGAGGEESNIFGNELLKIYSLICDELNIKYIFKNDILRINSKFIYQILQFETGVHRIQRIPITEHKGRIQTSTIGIFIKPIVKSVNFQLNLNECKIDTFRASGKGGQNVNKVETAVRVTHLPSNLVVVCQDNRDQLSNKQAALAELERRLKALAGEKETNQQNMEIVNALKDVGRSQKIRTYNVPQDRIVDHRSGLKINYSQFIKNQDKKLNFILKNNSSLHLKKIKL